MDKISKKVKEQYTLYPYPYVPIGEMESLIIPTASYTFVYYNCTRKYRKPEKIKILDAGCGTGFSTMKLAQQNPGAEIIGIDISSKSLEIASLRVKKISHLLDPNTKITLLKMDLLNLDSLKEKFDFIVSTGVIHHLSDPQKGLKNLVKKLKDDGIIHLLLYAKYPRHYINLTQRAIKILQLNQNDLQEGLKIGREFINFLPEDHPLKIDYKKHLEKFSENISIESSYSDSYFIDTYLNVNETSYTIDEIFDLLERTNLKFCCFKDEFHWDILKYFESNPLLLERVKKLSSKDKYKLIELLRQDQNHSFFAVKKNFKINKIEYTNIDILNKIPIYSPVLNKHKLNGILKITNNTGIEVELDKIAQFIFELIDGKKKVDEICLEFSNKFYLSIKDAQIQVINLIKQWEYYYLILYR